MVQGPPASASDAMARARQALAWVEHRLRLRPEVHQVDLVRADGAETGMAVRVHVAGDIDAAQLGLPDEIDGVAVRIVPAVLYRAE